MATDDEEAEGKNTDEIFASVRVTSIQNTSHSGEDKVGGGRSLPLRPKMDTPSSLPDNSRAVTPVVPGAPAVSPAPASSRLEGQLLALEAFSGLRDSIHPGASTAPRAPLPPPAGSRGGAEESVSNVPHMPHVSQNVQRSPSNTSYLVCPQMVAPPSVAANFPPHLQSYRTGQHRRGPGRSATGPPGSHSTNSSMSMSPRHTMPRGQRSGPKLPETHVTTSVVLSHLLQNSQANKAPHAHSANMAPMSGVPGAQQASPTPGLRLKAADASALVVKPPPSHLSPEAPVLNLEGGGMKMDPSATDVPYLMLLVPSTSLEGLDQQRQDSSAEPLWVEVGCRMVSARFVDVNFNL